TDRWKMAFLYHVPENGPTGTDGVVSVIDTEPVIVLSVGVRGDDGFARLDHELEMLREWISNRPDWTIAGDPRVLAYNGPNVRRENRWLEVQLPISPSEPQPSDHR
ncbi:MAG: hypothetical protein VYC34_05735, partial [Planctomycetota bacterium]|nr:hypothetical protein [Planctomycetota bacterium]